MPTVEEFLTKLASYVGMVESPPDSNCQPFSKRLGRPCEAWCADFQAAAAAEVGLELPSTSAYTPTMADAFRRAGRLFHDPQPGDLGFVDFPGDNHYGIQHVLAIKTVAATTVGTVEGNTSSGNVGSQDNGGGVFERSRPKLWIVGYGRPAFDTEPATLGPGGHIVSDEEAEMGCVVDRPQGGYIVVAHDGGVYAYGTAPYFGGVNQHPEWKLGGNIVGGTWTPSGNGYWLVAHDGAVFSFGDAQYRGGFNAETAGVRGSRFAVGMATVGAGYDIVTFDPSDNSPYDAYSYGV